MKKHDKYKCPSCGAPLGEYIGYREYGTCFYDLEFDAKTGWIDYVLVETRPDESEFCCQNCGREILLDEEEVVEILKRNFVSRKTKA